MSQPLQDIAASEPTPIAVEPETNTTGLDTVGSWWPHLLLGVAIAMAIFGVAPEGGVTNPLLIWLPVALLIGWLFLQILALYKPEKVEPVYPEYDELLEDDISSTDSPAAVATIAPSASGEPAAAAPAAPKKAALSLDGFKGVLLLWGSETGTAEGLADMAAARLKDAGLNAKSMDIGSMTAEALQGCQQVLVLTSTWGDGEPPSNAIPIWEALQKETFDLSAVSFSVLSLGDTAYTQFCQCGKDFDKFLAAHGAKRIFQRVDCDLDYEAPFEKWLTGVTAALQALPVPV